MGVTLKSDTLPSLLSVTMVCNAPALHVTAVIPNMPDSTQASTRCPMSLIPSFPDIRESLRNRRYSITTMSDAIREKNTAPLSLKYSRQQRFANDTTELIPPPP